MQYYWISKRTLQQTERQKDSAFQARPAAGVLCAEGAHGKNRRPQNRRDAGDQRVTLSIQAQRSSIRRQRPNPRPCAPLAPRAMILPKTGGKKGGKWDGAMHALVGCMPRLLREASALRGLFI